MNIKSSLHLYFFFLFITLLVLPSCSYRFFPVDLVPSHLHNDTREKIAQDLASNYKNFRAQEKEIFEAELANANEIHKRYNPVIERDNHHQFLTELIAFRSMRVQSFVDRITERRKRLTEDQQIRSGAEALIKKQTADVKAQIASLSKQLKELEKSLAKKSKEMKEKDEKSSKFIDRFFEIKDFKGFLDTAKELANSEANSGANSGANSKGTESAQLGLFLRLLETDKGDFEKEFNELIAGEKIQKWQKIGSILSEIHKTVESFEQQYLANATNTIANYAGSKVYEKRVGYGEQLTGITSGDVLNNDIKYSKPSGLIPWNDWLGLGEYRKSYINYYGIFGKIIGKNPWDGDVDDNNSRVKGLIKILSNNGDEYLKWHDEENLELPLVEMKKELILNDINRLKESLKFLEDDLEKQITYEKSFKDDVNNLNIHKGRLLEIEKHCIRVFSSINSIPAFRQKTVFEILGTLKANEEVLESKLALQHLLGAIQDYSSTFGRNEFRREMIRLGFSTRNHLRSIRESQYNVQRYHTLIESGIQYLSIYHGAGLTGEDVYGLVKSGVEAGKAVGLFDISNEL